MSLWLDQLQWNLCVLYVVMFVVTVWQQMLEEVCMKNGWGAPTYELHETVGFDCKLYAYKVRWRNIDDCLFLY